jgi:hypothetical protein
MEIEINEIELNRHVITLISVFSQGNLTCCRVPFYKSDSEIEQMDEDIFGGFGALSRDIFLYFDAVLMNLLCLMMLEWFYHDV